MNPDKAVVVLGHGSRNPSAIKVLEKVAELLALQTGWTVAHASLEFNRPTLAEAVADLYDRGFRSLFVAPYMLYAGNHVARDIPAQLECLLDEHPDLSVEITEPLGLDLRLVTVLEARIRTTMGEQGAVSAASVDSPAAIEGKSFEIITRLLPDLAVGPKERSVIIRIVHATGDPALASQLAFSKGAVEAGVAAITAGVPVMCDVNMVRSGIMPSLRRLGVDVRCLIEDPETIALAKAEGVTRSVAAMRVARDQLEGAIVAIGNAPTALLEVVRLAREEGVRPALVVGVPVGFVAAAESKEALLASGLEYVTLPGLRGGTPIAVATVNALARLAAPDPGMYHGAPVVVGGSGA